MQITMGRIYVFISERIGRGDFLSTKADCIIHRNEHSFVLPGEILEATKKGNLVLFAGAGISTEGKGVFPNNLYEIIADELNKKELTQSFSELMEEYCEKPNGRTKLLKRFMKRLDYVESFSEMKFWTCRFHMELQTVYSIKEIITTNWDNYFEEVCGCIPFVTSKDFALSNTDRRKVYKIHGSISNLGSIVATKTDYEECYEQLHRGLIGSTLKMLLSNPEKQIVFIGYSLTDEDFIRIVEYLESELGEFMPHYYVVTLDKNINRRLDSKKYTPIITDATYFIKTLKSKLVEEEFMVDDIIYEFAGSALGHISEIHTSITEEQVSQYPDLVYSMVYQDGLIHAFQRVVSMKKTGYYSDIANIMRSIQGYLQILETKEKLKDYYEQAYVVGYLNGLISLVDLKFNVLPPLFYTFDNEEIIYTLDEYMEQRKNFIINNREIFECADKLVKDKSYIIMHHPPRL